MNGTFEPSYVSGLRMKTGELVGLNMLKPDIAAKILPRLIVPPPKDRDKQLQSELFSLSEQPRVHGLIGKYWLRRPVLIQCTHLLSEIKSVADRWLPALFADARDHGVEAIPAFRLDEIVNAPLAVRNTIAPSDPLQLAILIRSGEIGDPNLSVRVTDALRATQTDFSRVIVLADFSDAYLGDPEIVAPIIRGAFETLQGLGPWKLLAFQGTAYPEHNPAQHGKTESIDRSEWLAWNAAVHYGASTSGRLLFGDYGADCSKINFAKGRARAIRHIRYTTSERWYIVRAKEKGTDSDLMQDVCSRIVTADWYDGRDYSVADDHIFRIARRMRGPGRAFDWRAFNTAHHITRVVRDLGAPKKEIFTSLDAKQLEIAPEEIPQLIL
jgi:hypothetical protein